MRGCLGGQAHPPVSYHASPLSQGFHLSISASARHPGLNVELAVSRETQFLGGHVQHPESKSETGKKSRGQGKGCSAGEDEDVEAKKERVIRTQRPGGSGTHL